MHKSKGSAKKMYKFVHCQFPELGHPMCNVSVQHKARTDWSIFTKSKQLPNTPGADLGGGALGAAAPSLSLGYV